MASAPDAAAKTASSSHMIPLIISGPCHRSLTHLTSSQVSVGSSCSADHCASVASCSTPLACPTTLPNVKRFDPSILMHHPGCIAMFKKLDIVILGGTDKPFVMSLWRCPIICRSAVNTNAEHPAAFARSISLRINSRSFIT